MDGSLDNEAPKDPGVCQPRYTEQDYEGKCTATTIEAYDDLIAFILLRMTGHRAHTVYVGVHMPSNRRSHRRHKHHHKDSDEKVSEYDRPRKYKQTDSIDCASIRE